MIVVVAMLVMLVVVMLLMLVVVILVILVVMMVERKLAKLFRQTVKLENRSLMHFTSCVFCAASRQCSQSLALVGCLAVGLIEIWTKTKGSCERQGRFHTFLLLLLPAGFRTSCILIEISLKFKLSQPNPQLLRKKLNSATNQKTSNKAPDLSLS